MNMSEAAYLFAVDSAANVGNPADIDFTMVRKQKRSKQ